MFNLNRLQFKVSYPHSYIIEGLQAFLSVFIFFLIYFFCFVSVAGMSPLEVSLEVVEVGLSSELSTDIDSAEGHFARHKNTYLIIGGIAIVAICFCVGFYVFKGRGGDSSSSTDSFLEEKLESDLFRGAADSASFSDPTPTANEVAASRPDSTEEASVATEIDVESFVNRLLDNFSSVDHCLYPRILADDMPDMRTCLIDLVKGDFQIEVLHAQSIVPTDTVVEACRTALLPFLGINVLSSPEVQAFGFSLSVLAIAALSQSAIVNAIRDVPGGATVIASCYLDNPDWVLAASDPEVSEAWVSQLGVCLKRGIEENNNLWECAPCWDLCVKLWTRATSIEKNILQLSKLCELDLKIILLGQILGNADVFVAVANVQIPIL